MTDIDRDKCYFDRGSYCSALTAKQCDGCTFRKTGFEYMLGTESTKRRLDKLGVEVCQRTLLGTRIVTTRRKALEEMKKDEDIQGNH